MSPQTINHEINDLIERYLSGLHTGNVDLLRYAFHATCQLQSIDAQGAITALSRDAWLDLVSQRQSPDSLGHAREQEILSIDVANPNMASVKLWFTVPQRRFTDFLLLLRSTNGWQIAAKTYTAEEI